MQTEYDAGKYITFTPLSVGDYIYTYIYVMSDQIRYLDRTLSYMNNSNKDQINEYMEKKLYDDDDDDDWCTHKC